MNYIEAFPEELQINILSRLQLKQLSRCKCVSKHWNTTLTIQVFMFRHSRSYDKHSKLVFVAHKNNSILSYELSGNNSRANSTMTIPKTTKMSVINSGTMEISTEEVIIGNDECITEALLQHKCNVMSNICHDLICLFDFSSARVGLFNLKTREFIQLPAVTTKSAYNIKSWYAIGFDPVSTVYKVLSIYGGSEECHTSAAIITLGSNHWKPIEYKFLRSAVAMTWRYFRRNNMFCLDGVIYRVNDNEINGAIVLTVVAFDLNREVFRDYKLDTIPIKDAETIRYYLTSLKGCPTLFIRKDASDEIQQLTLFDHKNPEAAWSRRNFIAHDFWGRRNFIAHDFPEKFPYRCLVTCIAGGSILLQSLKPTKSDVKHQELDNPLLSYHIWYDLENLAIE